MLYLENEIFSRILSLLPDLLFLTFSFSALVIVNGRRFNVKKTILISIPFLIVLLVSNLFLLANIEKKYIPTIAFFTLFLPQAMLSVYLGEERGWFAVSACINAFIVVYMVNLIVTSFYDKFNKAWITYTIYVIFLPLLLYFLRNFYLKLHKLIEYSLPKMIYILILLGFSIFIEIITYGVMIRDSGSNILRLDIFGIATISIYILAISAFYLIMNEYNNKAIEKREQEVLENGIEAVEDKLRIRQLKDEQLRVLRHDMKHLLISLSSLINANENEEALELIKNYTNVIEANSDKKFCIDPVINALLDYYAARCEKNHITYDIKINNIEEALYIPSTELAIFLSNILDNAINAVMKLSEDKRFIYFRFINNDGRLILQLKNNFNGAIVLNKNNKPTSIYNGHGIGTESIERFCQRHDLSVSYDIQDKVFIINVMFANK